MAAKHAVHDAVDQAAVADEQCKGHDSSKSSGDTGQQLEDWLDKRNEEQHKVNQDPSCSCSYAVCPASKGQQTGWSPALTTSLFLLSLAAASFLPRCVKSSMAGENAMGMPNTFLQG